MKVIEDYYGELPFPLTNDQKNVLVDITRNTDGHYAMLGVNGSGKSTIMELLAKFYKDEIIFCASSGTASKNLPANIGSGTSHSILSLSTERATEEFLKNVNKTTTNLFQVSDLIKIVVIDEAFALDSDKFYTMLRRVERFNKGTKKRKKRNIRLILVGDILQRLPIASAQEKSYMNEKHGHWLMFKSRLWIENKVKTYILTEVKRQDDKVFKAFLDVIRYGQTERYPKALAWINQRYSEDYDDTNLLLAPTNAIVNAANALSLQRNPNPKGTWCATKVGSYNMKDSPLEPSVTLAVGSPVITLVNHEEGLYCNGSFGHVTQIYPHGVDILFVGEDYPTLVEAVVLREEEIYIEKGEDEEGNPCDVQKKRIVGTCTGLPVRMAAAYTCAKSQGKTFKGKINIDFGDTKLYTSKYLGDFGTSDVLVGLSRATSVENITLLRKIEPAHIKVCRESIAYWNDTLAAQNASYATFSNQ